MLPGDDEEAVGNTRCYIGEADIVADRLRYHQREKEFWDRVVVITSKDANLTKADVRYLESTLISLATQAGRVTLDNGTAPTIPALPEADKSELLKSAKRGGLLQAADARFSSVLSQAIEWVKDTRNAGEAHGGGGEDYSMSDAWMVVHVVGALIIRLADKQPHGNG